MSSEGEEVAGKVGVDGFDDNLIRRPRSLIQACFRGRVIGPLAGWSERRSNGGA